MDSINIDCFHVYFKDLSKKCRKNLKKYLEDNGIDDLAPIISGEIPIIVIGYQDDTESMVS